MKRGTFPESLKSGGHVSPVPPVLTSMRIINVGSIVQTIIHKYTKNFDEA